MNLNFISRVKALVAANMPGQEELVAVIPAPKEIDPRVLAWKGVAVLSKLESLSDLWIQQADWVSVFSSRFDGGFVHSFVSRT